MHVRLVGLVMGDDTPIVRLHRTTQKEPNRVEL
jgi:hypothetical protein